MAKVLKVKQVALGSSGEIIALAEDGSLWQTADAGDTWTELPAIEVEEDDEAERDE